MPSSRRGSLLIFIALVLQGGCHDASLPPALPNAGEAVSFKPTTRSESRHFEIASTADPSVAADAERAAETLFDAYQIGFNLEAAAAGTPSKHHLRLYATREEFQAHNRSRPWAEAYYRDGVCHAYLDPSKPNPYHWLLHEVVHQLNRELTGFAKERWINEGLATYFGSSRYADGVLRPGEPDLDTYPLWWLKRWELSGDWDADVQAQRVIPLRALITGQGGPPLDATVNAHYLGWWSLTHFLLHHDGGRYAAGYQQLIRHGGSMADFERHIGPVAEVEREWYAYLQGFAR